jgi:UDP-GlcNAc:undecaprenyl-phosphate GlcNAc-1-phosphate transferase
MELQTLLIPLLVAFGVAMLATPWVVRLARALHIEDRPNERAVNSRAGMPLAGGLAVALGFAAGLGVALGLVGDEIPLGHVRGLVIGSSIMLVSGLIDDRFGMKAYPKFSLQFAAAAVAIYSGFEIGHVTDPIAQRIYQLPTWLSWAITTLWIVGITNAINLIDGLDGLASGVGAIIGSTLLLIAWQTGQPLGVCLGVALVGSVLGFLPFNFWPARIFLGDTGSLLIGYLLALLALEGYRQVSLLTFVVPLLALAVPILDTALSVLRRLRLRAPIFSADRLHMHHRLLDAEGSHRGAVLQFYFLTVAFCLIALSFTKLRGVFAAGFLVAVVLLTLRLLWNLGALSLESGSDASPELAAGGEKEEP